MVVAVVTDTSTVSRDKTVLAIGPGPSVKIDAITKHLKLFDEA